MARLRENFQRGVVSDNPLTAAATTLTSDELASFPVVASPDIAVLVLDPIGDGNGPELVHITAHTASATTATIVRGQEGTTGVEHAQGTVWNHTPTTDDYLAGIWTLANRAAGDATTDDRAVIQAILDAAEAHAAAHGSAVVDGGGLTYRVGSAVFVGSRVKLRNASFTVADNFLSTSTIIQTPIRGGSTPGQFHAVVATKAASVDVTFERVRVDGNGDNLAPANMAGILVHDTTDAKVLWCEARNIIYDGFETDSATRQFGVAVTDAVGTRILGGTYDRCGYECIAIRNDALDTEITGSEALDGWQTSAQAASCSDVLWEGVTFSKRGVDFGGAGVTTKEVVLTLHNCRRIVASNCFYLNGRLSLLGDEGGANKSEDHVIRGGVLFTADATDIANQAGILIEGVPRVTIEGLTLFWDAPGLETGSRHGITVNTNRGVPHNLKIRGCTIRANRRAVSFEGATDTAIEGAIIEGNHVEGLAGATGGAGIRLAGQVVGARVVHNVVLGSTEFGILLRDNSTDCLIEGNDVSAPADLARRLDDTTGNDNPQRRNRGVDTEFDTDRFISGRYYGAIVAGSTLSTATPGQNAMRAVPFPVARRVPLDRIGIEVVTAAAGSSVRLGIFRDNGDVYPGALLADYGTVDSTTTGGKELTISEILMPGLYWLAAVSQGGTPTLRSTTGGIVLGMANLTQASTVAYGQGSVSGALPATFTSTPDFVTNVARILVRAV